MTPGRPFPAREDVLDAFAVEPSPDRETLERYLREYPQFAPELVDLSRELARDLCEDEDPLSSDKVALIDMAWQRHQGAGQKVVTDPFAKLSVTDLRELAKSLDVPRQVITAFRERRLILTSVPRRFLTRLAALVGVAADQIMEALAPHPAPDLARSYKSDGKPDPGLPLTFEQLLTEAGVPAEKRDLLLSDDD
jgi:hypothetical protein